MPDITEKASAALAERLAAIRARYVASDPDMVADVVRAILATMSGDLTAKETTLLTEVESLGRTIAAAKAEIAALRVDDITVSDIPFATDELDAIVAAYRRGHARDPGNLRNARCGGGASGRRAGRATPGCHHAIYEACGFQDITGQRITKVVNTLKVIETKIGQLVATFGEPNGEAAAVQCAGRGGAAERAAASDHGDGPVGHRQVAREFRVRGGFPRNLCRFVAHARAVGGAFVMAALLVEPALLVAPVLYWSRRSYSRSAGAFADPVAVTIRSGDHPDFGRIVFDAPPHMPYHVVRDGDHLTVKFAGDAALAGDPRLPRNIKGLQADHAEAVLTVASGATFHDARLGDHVVIDVFDPAPSAADAAAEPQARHPAPPAPGRTASKPSGRQTASAAAPASDAAAATHASTPGEPKPSLSQSKAAVSGQAKPASAATRPASPAEAAAAPKAAGKAAQTATQPAAERSAAATAVEKSGAEKSGAEKPGVEKSRAEKSGAEKSGAEKPAGAEAADRAAKAAGTPTSTGPRPAAAATPAAVATPAAAATPAAFASGPPSVAPASPAALSSATEASSPPGDPAALAAAPAALPPGTRGSAFSVPFPADVGAAVFRRRGETFVVFDDRHPIDMTALQSDPAFAGARVELLPAGTAIRMTQPPGVSVALSKGPQGWTVAALAAAPQPLPFAPQADNAQLSVVAREPGGVLAIPDPATGDTLLVGTQRQAGQAMTTLRRMPQFNLLPTTQGFVVAPLADTVTLRVVPNGFSLTTVPDPLAVSPRDAEVPGDVAALTRRFTFPDLPPDQLLRQLSKQIADAGAEPILARGPKRRAAAVTMISLGMDAEAEALLQLTAADDPRQASLGRCHRPDRGCRDARRPAGRGGRHRRPAPDRHR